MLTAMVLIVILIATCWRAEVGLAISLQSYLIRSAPYSPNYIESASNMDGDPLLSIAAPLLVYVIILLKRFSKEEKYRIRNLDTYFFLLGIALLIGTLYAPSQYESLVVSIKYFTIGVGYYYIARLYFAKHEAPHKAGENFMVATWLIAFILGSYAYIQSFGQDYFRLTIGNAHPIPFSLLIASGVLINLFWLFQKRHSPPKQALFFCSLFILLVIFISANTRGTILSLLGALFFLLLVSLVQKKLKIKYMIVGVIVLLFSSLLVNLLIPNTLQTVKNNLGLITSEDKGVSINERSLAYEDAIKLFQDQLWLGVGTAGFKYYSIIDYPHNVFLEIMSENGIYGTIMLLLIFLTLIFMLVRIIYKGSGIMVLVGSLVVLNMVEMQFSFSLWMHKFFFLLCGILISIFVKEIKHKKTKEIKHEECMSFHVGADYGTDTSFRYH
ncbi:O-antigen ligase family protein [Paenibacillus sp. 32O-W]|uniref:O-antigen ligase family protein n=1 Tax=Paenibacillus sp. 32O-W TaxID=1695218 RepID=UPI0013651AD6|nr:O-antigen ligase family protein [Paenibacillus sp. 32O-W]